MPKLIYSLFLLLFLQCSHAHAGAYDEILADAEHNRTDAVLELLQLGMDVNTSMTDGTTLLMTAARNGNFELLDALLNRRANHLMRNKYGDTALMLAALNGRLKVVQRLSDLPGAQENSAGWTALQYAAFGGHIDVARYLLSKGAKIDAPAPNSQTALMLAASAGNLAMVRFLLDEQANRKLKDHDGRTAQAIAASKGHNHVADFFAAYDATEK